MKKVILYIGHLAVFGGIETFTYNFCSFFGKEYDLTLLIKEIPDNQLNKLKKVVKIVTDMKPIECDTLLMLRMNDTIPINVSYKKVIRRFHSNKFFDIQTAPTDGDITVCVSKMVKDSWKLKDAVVINNVFFNTTKPTLLLMSATRLPALDKGENVDRMRKLGNMLDDADIPYLWLNFSNKNMENPPKNFFNLGMRMDVQNYLQKADYIVQLSTVEACSNTVLEALNLEVPLICTPVPSFYELGVVDGVSAHVVPFDMNFDVHKLLNIPKFRYNYDNEGRLEQWRKIL